MYAPPPSIDETWPLWVLGVLLASAGMWALLGRVMSPLAVARAAAILVAVAGVALYAWFAREELVGSTAIPSARVTSVIEMTLYILLPAVAPLYLLRRTGPPEGRRIASALGVVVTIGALTLSIACFFLFAWASQVGQRGGAMIFLLSPLGFIAVTGVTLARSAWRAARE